MQFLAQNEILLSSEFIYVIQNIIYFYTHSSFSRAYFSSKFSIFSCKGRHIRRHCTKACPHFLTRGSLSRVWKYLRRGARTAIFPSSPFRPSLEIHTPRISISRAGEVANVCSTSALHGRQRSRVTRARNNSRRNLWKFILGTATRSRPTSSHLWQLGQLI